MLTRSSSGHGLLAFLRDFEKCFTSHILYTWECLVHELEQLVHDGLQKLPVRLEEARVLANDIHDVTCYDLHRTERGTGNERRRLS